MLMFEKLFWIVLIYFTFKYSLKLCSNCCIIILYWSLVLYCGLWNFPLFVPFTKSGIFFDWIIILIWIFFALSQISLSFISYQNNDTKHSDIHSVLRRSKKFGFFIFYSFIFLFSIFLVTWPEQKKFEIFVCHLKDNFITKKQALTFAILTSRSWA